VLFSSVLLVVLLATDAFSANTLFAPARNISVPGTQTQLAALVDLNHDGNLDLVIGRRYGPSFTNGEILVLLGKGDGTFRSPRQYQTGNYPAFAIADVNNDGNLDVIAIDRCPVGNSNCPPGEVEVFLGNGDGTLQAPIFSAYEQAGEAFNIAVADFDGDGKVDLAATFDFLFSLPLHDSGLAFRGNGDGTFLGWSGFEQSSPRSDLVDLVAGDFNGDGKMDLTVMHSQHGIVDILLGDGAGNFIPTSSFPTGHGRSLTTADLNGDGYLDIAVTNQASVQVHYGNGDGTFQTPIGLTTTASPDPQQVIAADFDGDGRLDLAVALGSDDQLALYLNKPNGTFQKSLFTVPGGPGKLAAGDLNHDGYPDIVTANFEVTGTDTFTSVSVFLNASATTLAPSKVSFPSRKIGTSASKTATLTNSGTKTLNIKRILISGANAGCFSQTNCCPASLASGENCSILVEFSPKGVGSRIATLTVVDDGVGSPHTLALSGTGTTP
jgi:hypothetical protein